MIETEEIDMLEIGNTIVSLDLFTKYFICDYKACKGICCEDGDGGAPLTAEEDEKIKSILPEILPLLPRKAKEIIEKQGTSYIDEEGDLVTSIIGNRECVFSYRDKDGWKCAIETAYNAGKVDFKKPISCHLYPVRLTEYPKFTAVNFHKWDICDWALAYGKREKVPVYKFLKEPLIRKFGEEWYAELEEAAEAFYDSDYYRDMKK